MPKFKIYCYWEVCGELEIEADTLEDAISKADELPLPDDPEYIDGSFTINYDVCEELNEAMRQRREQEEKKLYESIRKMRNSS